MNVHTPVPIAQAAGNSFDHVGWRPAKNECQCQLRVGYMSGLEGMDFTWREIGIRIRDWRLARGWSQHQLAQAAGLSQSGVVHLEKGDTNPQLSTLREVAQAFGKSLRELMFGLPGQRPTESAGLCDRVCRIVDSKDQAALSALEYGLRMAELLLERRSGRAGSGASGLLEADAAVTALQQRLPDGVAAHPSRESEPKGGRRRPPRR